jgi:hypothetical protein
LARCVLSNADLRVACVATALIGLGALALSGCRGEHHAAPSAATSAAASASGYARSARESHLESELKRARARWGGKPNLAECSAALHEKDDLELCQAASNALVELEKDPEAPAERALPALETAALSLARLVERARFLSLSELAKKRLSSDAGAPVPPAASTPGHAPWPRLARGKPELDHAGPFAISDGPVSRLMSASVRLEHDAIRNLGAYLEYGELPLRRAAFATVKRLHEQHPRWPQLAQLLREATLLEDDASLKSELSALSASAQPSSSPASHSAGSK